MLTVDTIPLQTLLGFLVIHVLATRVAKLLKLETASSLLFVLGRHVILVFAFFANKRDVISGHYLNSKKSKLKNCNSGS